MQAACPGCNTIYVLDERQIVAKDATLSCLECGTTWSLRTGPGGSSRPKPREAVTRADTPSPRSKRVPPRVKEPVTCPECGHAFAPGPSPVQGAAVPKTQPRARDGGRILLVEDQKYFVELTREVLGESFQTTVVSNLSEASGVLDTEEFDLVILDLSLDEGEDGAKMLRTTKQRGIPVLIFTARDETELYGEPWENLRSAGATDLLIKGINVGEELKQKVGAILHPGS